jgi:hypothetical protein
MDVQGHMVQDLYEEGRLDEINDYCRCDVLDTYFVFLRAAVLLGRLPLTREQEVVAETKTWLADRSAGTPAFKAYLDHWGDWTNPWQDGGRSAQSAQQTVAAQQDFQVD